ncbi:DUF6531 domain-containing protein [Streptomyces sp. NPDC050610]|uniref:DUF6531 domain-containing protein n=1 Tax=Streptomyces sp. NPDC050610 TaxID=3157097 RepID=UPI003423FDF6
MSAAEKAKGILEHLGLHWPAGDPGKLREAAKAWRTFAGRVDDVHTPVHHAASSLIHNNKGEAIDAFEVFWSRYAKDGGAGWLHDLAKASRDMADGLDELARRIDDARHKLWTSIEASAAVIVAGAAATWFTGGLSDIPAALAVEGILGLGSELELAIVTAAEEIAANALVGAAFGGVETVALDLAVAQPVKILRGDQSGISLTEINDAANSGMLYGGVFGGGAAGLSRMPPNGELFRLPQPVGKGIELLRRNVIKLGQACRRGKEMPCVGEPIDVASGDMLMMQTDLVLPADLPLVFERTHLSSYRAGVCFGPAWASTLDERIQLDAQGVVFAAADGMRLVYPVPRPQEPVLPVKGARWPLEWDGRPDGTVTITDPGTGVVRTFGHSRPTSEPGTVELPLESRRDRNGARMDVERTAEGVPTGIRHSGGYYLAVDTQGPRITALRLLEEAPSRYAGEPRGDADGSLRNGGTVVVRYGYDAAGNLTEVVNSSGKPLRFTYDEAGRVTSWTDRNGTSFAYVYDARGRVVRTEGSDGVLSGTLAYDDDAHTTVYTDSLGRRTAHRYNADGQVTSETDPLGHVTRTEWNDRGDLRTAVTDPLGRTTRYAYDALGNLTEVILPDGSAGRATYNGLGRPVEVVEPGGAVWRHAYDERGNLTATVDPMGAETRYAYDDAGHLIAVTDPLGHTRRVTVDAAGLPAAVTDALGHTTTVRRDACGRVVETTDPLGHTTRMGWTTEGKPRWRELPDGARETWEWDGEGNLLTYTDAAGNVTRQTSTHFDVPATRTDPDGAVYAFAYDTELRLTGVTNPQGLTWSYEYDPAGRLASETDFDGRTLTYEHDAAGDVVARTNGAGERLRFERDALRRVVEQRGDGGATVVYEHDAAGRLVRAANADTELVMERDALGRVLRESVNGRATTYEYDALGHRLLRVTPSGMASEWAYDAEGNPTELRSDAGALAFTRDAAGRETERSLAGGSILRQTWDKSDRLTTQTICGTQANDLLQHRAYAYRPDGYLTEIRELTSGTRRFDLDAVGRITGVSAHGWTECYAYDGVGNLTRGEAPAHGSSGEREFSGALIRRAGRTRYEYDAQGRRTRKTRKLLNGQTRTWTYAWSAEDRLTELVTPGGERWRYAYDPLGRRIAKQRLSDTGAVAEGTHFTWDESRLAEQISPDGRAVTWDYAPHTHCPLTQTDRRPLNRTAGESLITKYAELSDPGEATQFHAIITDLVGTPMELVTPAGEVAWQHRTALWGADSPAPTDTSTATCPLRFPGQYADAEADLHYNYFRYYDPEIASYVSPDPLGLDPAPNHYRYVDNPLTLSDVLGLGCGTLDLSGATPHQGRFPKTSQPNETLVRRKQDGSVTAYAVYDSDGAMAKRVDIDPDSAVHNGIAPPHVVPMEKHVNPKTGKIYYNWGETRPARPDEIPTGH